MNKRYLAFETGGTKLVAAVAGEDRRLLETRVIARRPGADARESLTSLLELGAALRREHENQGGRFQAAALGFGGTVDRAARRPHRCLHEDGWEAVDVVARLEDALGIPSAIENDCKLAALAESHYGAGRGAKTVFYVTLGTGVGGGLVHDGRVVELGPIGEAEIGHLVVNPDGPHCWCGSRGCVEAMCSGPGISRLAGWLAERESGAGSSHAEAVSSKQYIERWQAGDRFARAVIEESTEALATALGAAINLTAAECVVVGGGLGAGSPEYLALASAKAVRRIVPYFRDRVRITASSLGEQVVTQGAAILAAQIAQSPSAKA